ncbi:MAG TPA: monovalent cation/H(+) antiporter subunit G [Longimicrobiales bacterium]|nr:monovalent cation/H(+) antiporter subunit G [Longimicrobiales bacterium]
MSGIEMPLWVTVPASLLLVTGGSLALIGAIGLLRLPDFFSRMHPPTMGTTLGVGCVLLSSMLVSSALRGRPVVHEVLITVFVIMTTPVTAMLLARAARHRDR